ncbi:MAG TPA: M1 family metallopeptidase [Bryobacteraceae bacterium]|nr:M1 family metallopeptidase [Bryobacteraceae bacterium]
MKIRFGRTVAGTLLGVGVWATQAAADNYPRQPGVDAQHYIFRVTLNDENDEITGESTAILKFVKDGVTEVALDLTSAANGKGMTVTEVTSGGAAAHFTHTADRLKIALSPAPKAGETRPFTVKYHGIAATGLHILQNKFGERCFFSVNWPTLGRQWLPMIDHPSDKATSEFLITAPAKYQVVANGLLQEVVELGDGRRMTHWKQSVPIASWLNNIGVAQFAMRRFGVSAGIPLETWVFHQDRDNGIVTFETPTRQAIEFYSDHVGPYPYEKLADVEAAGMGGGMEHASEIFYGQTSVTNRPAFGLVAHEISHQWFGDSVTEKDWDDAWLSEGFATYFALLCTEYYQGREPFVAGLQRSRTTILAAEKRTPGVAVIHDNLPEIQNGRAPVGIVYQKGGWSLHMLRGEIGTDKFWAGMREYYKRFRDSNASTEDLRKVMEEVSGQKLDWFFQQWLYRAGSPAVEGGWSYNPSSKKVEIQLTQTQAGDAFRLPLEIGIKAAGAASPKIVKIEMTQKQQRFDLASDQQPASVDLDPNTWILMDAKFTPASQKAAQ